MGFVWQQDKLLSIRHGPKLALKQVLQAVCGLIVPDVDTRAGAAKRHYIQENRWFFECTLNKGFIFIQ